MRHSIRIASALVIALGCNVKYSSSSSSPSTSTASTDPSAGKPVETAESAGKPIEKPDPEAEKKAKEKAEFDAEMKKLEAEFAKESERLTPEVRAQIAKLTAKKYSSAKLGLMAAMGGPQRTPGAKDRDASRHPVKTMEVFGLRPDMRVFEVGPGRGWWTELLAVVLAQRGKLVLASFDPKSDDMFTAYSGRAMELMINTKSPELYGKVELVPNASVGAFEMGPPDSLDMVLTMRMAHNLVRFGGFEKFLAASFTALKPGGVLAIEQHRAAEGGDPKVTSEKGYLPEAWLIQQVEAAGFKLEKKSEVNANPKDTKDYEKGVWTLPPTFADGDKDKAKYEAIGESDRMTLKFVKPKTKPASKTTPAAGGDIKATPSTDAGKTDGKKVKPEAGKAIAAPEKTETVTTTDGGKPK